MKIYTCVDHDGFWPVGVTSIVIATTDEQAYELLKEALKQRGLDYSAPFTLKEVNQNLPRAIILNDGNY